jgi:hypothetical protein
MTTATNPPNVPEFWLKTSLLYLPSFPSVQTVFVHLLGMSNATADDANQAAATEAGELNEDIEQRGNEGNEESLRVR